MLIQLAPGGAVWPAAIMMWGPGYNATAHRHHCVQLLMALRGSLLVRGQHDEAWRKCGAALVRPDALHQADGRGTTVLIGFMDAESEVGAALCDRIDGDITCLPSHQVYRWRAVLGWPFTEATVEHWVTHHLLHRRRPVNIDARVMRVVEHLRQRVAVSGDLSLQLPGRGRGALILPLHSPVHRVDRRPPASIHSLASAAARVVRADPRRDCLAGRPSRGLLRRRAFQPDISPDARLDSHGKERVAESGACSRHGYADIGHDRFRIARRFVGMRSARPAMCSPDQVAP